MTASSEHGGFWNWDATDAAVADGPVSANWFRNSALNNAAHHYDSMTQERIGFYTADGDSALRPSTIVTTGWDAVAYFGPFPLTLRADRTTARLVLRFGVALSQAATGTWLAALMPLPDLRRFGSAELRPDEAAPHSLQITSASTTPTYVDPTPDYVYVEDAAMIARATHSMPMERDEPGGEMTTVDVALFYLGVWARSSSGSAWPELYSLYGREFIG